MRNIIIFIAMYCSGCVPAMALNGTVGFIGASYSSGTAPSGYCINGGEYLDLPTALTKISDYWIISAAQGGASSYDKPGGWDGYMTQAWKLAAKSAVGNKTTLRVLVIDLVKECSTGCTTFEIEEMIDRISEVISLAVQYRIKVVVAGYPDLSFVDPMMALRHESRLAAIPGVIYAKIYTGITTIDGVHPDTASMKIAAKRLETVLRGIDQIN